MPAGPLALGTQTHVSTQTQLMFFFCFFVIFMSNIFFIQFFCCFKPLPDTKKFFRYKAYRHKYVTQWKLFNFNRFYLFYFDYYYFFKIFHFYLIFKIVIQIFILSVQIFFFILVVFLCCVNFLNYLILVVFVYVYNFLTHNYDDYYFLFCSIINDVHRHS